MKKKLLLTFFVILLVLSILSATMTGVTATDKHDIAIISVTPSFPTVQEVVKAGDSINITVAIENQGDFTETFNVTTHYDTTAIKTETNITLAAGATTSLTFTWNTTDVRKEVYAAEYPFKEKTYTIKATASTVPEETDTEDNAGTCNVKVVSQYIAVIPQSTVDTTLTPGKNYTVSIYTDYNGTDVWGYEFTLEWNPNVLEGVEVTNGDLIVGGTATFQEGTFDNVNGKLSLTGAYFDYIPPEPAPQTHGPGTLANVTFTVVGTGDSDIELGTEATAPSRLIGIDEFGDKYNIIDDITPELDHIVHGYFRNTIEKPVHDVAVVRVTPNATLVEAGEPVNVTVVVKNNGTVPETFTVEVYYDHMWTATRIGTETVSTLGAGANKSLTFTWDTTDVGEGDHTIIAWASEVPGEEDTENNKLESDKKVRVTLPPEEPLPIGLIIGVVVVIVVVIAVAAYAVKRRKKPTLK